MSNQPDRPGYDDLLRLLNEANELIANQGACIRELLDENDRYARALSQSEIDAEELFVEAGYWERLWSETIRFYGHKQGRLGEMMKKARERLSGSCYAYAVNPEKDAVAEKLFAEAAGDEWPKIKEHYLKRKSREFSRMYNPEPMLRRYGDLTGYPVHRTPTPDDLAWREERERERIAMGRDPFIDRAEAIKVIAREFKFATPETAYKYLQRLDVAYLPSTWPKA